RSSYDWHLTLIREIGLLRTLSRLSRWISVYCLIHVGNVGPSMSSGILGTFVKCNRTNLGPFIAPKDGGWIVRFACSGITKAQNAFDIAINYPSMEEAWEQRSRYVQWLKNGLHRP
ncbi:hypothetical protein, partial [Cupriavidus sp. amp6]|uniref:hypothetical protein n=1 Tax=Cupriavidus sp. amp6 TaxID=388051 RepID=UPI001E419BDF